MTPQERLRAWGAEPVGEPWSTPSSVLAVGMRDGVPVVLKIARVEEEVAGNALLAWWDGRGAVPVLEHDGDGVLMLRATGPRDLAEMAGTGRDPEATAVLVDAAVALHAHGLPPDTVPLVPLRRWFRELLDEPQHDPLPASAASVACGLLDGTTEADLVALHGDVHHGNVLDLGDRWGAIDPKALLGHRAFDFANILCNPDAETASRHLDDVVRERARHGRHGRPDDRRAPPPPRLTRNGRSDQRRRWSERPFLVRRGGTSRCGGASPRRRR